MDDTIKYYNQNAESFCKNTVNVDMGKCRKKFMKYIPKGAYILDAGCGSGRDSKVFFDNGYRVEAIDASERICGIASAYLGQAVKNINFEEINYQEDFDGIWACASLLHVSKEKLPEIMKKMHCALKDGGILYASFKYGSGERTCGLRFFNDFTESTAIQLFENADFKVLECFITHDERNDRENELWVNIIGRKSKRV